MVEKHNIRKNNTPLIINLPMVEEDMISYVGKKKGERTMLCNKKNYT